MAFATADLNYATTDFINVWNAHVQLTYPANRLVYDAGLRRWLLDGVVQNPTNVSLSMVRQVIDKVNGATTRSSTASINFGEFTNPSVRNGFTIKKITYYTSNSTDIPQDYASEYVQIGTRKFYLQVVVNTGVTAPGQKFGGGSASGQYTWHNGFHAELVNNGNIYGYGNPGQPGISIINGTGAIRDGDVLAPANGLPTIEVVSGTTQTAVEIINNGTIAGGGGAGGSGHPYAITWGGNTSYVIAGAGGGAGQNYGTTQVQIGDFIKAGGQAGLAGIVSGIYNSATTQYNGAGGSSASSGTSGAGASAGGSNGSAAGEVQGFPGYVLTYVGGAGGAGGGWGSAGGTAPNTYTETKSGAWSGTTTPGTGFPQYNTLGGLSIQGLNRVVLTTTGTLIGSTANI
jgi:hypothetical protein